MINQQAILNSQAMASLLNQVTRERDQFHSALIALYKACHGSLPEYMRSPSDAAIDSARAVLYPRGNKS